MAGVNDLFTYRFEVMPDHRRKMNRALFDLFILLDGRVETQFTELNFEKFRAGLLEYGLSLRDVEKVPLHAPKAAGV